MDADEELLIAAEEGDLPSVQWLILECGANLNGTYKDGITPLMSAAQLCRVRGEFETTRWLVEHREADLALADSRYGNTVWDYLGVFRWEHEAAPAMLLLRAMLQCSKLLNQPIWWLCFVRWGNG
jgi:hypothetical protein